MTRALIALGAATFIAATPASGSIVVGFDDVVTTDGWAPMPIGYGGITWESTQWYVYSSVQYPYTPASPPNRAATNNNFNEIGNLSFSFASPVKFEGMFFSGSNVAVPIRYTTYLNGTTMSVVDVGNPTAVPTYFTNPYAGPVNRVTIYGYRGWYVIDDVTYSNITITPPSPVPEIGTWLAVLTGFGLIGALSRRRPIHFVGSRFAFFEGT